MNTENGRDREDRRVRRTRRLLEAALTSLITEKGYDKITVQDLIDRADVGRSTFYAHYETKDALLVSTLHTLTADIEQHVREDPTAADAILPSLGVFRHVAGDHTLHKALLGSRGSNLVREAAFELLTERALSAIGRRAGAGDHPDIPPEARAAFVAGSLMAFLRWWLDNDLPYPPEQMADMFQRLTAGAQ